MVVTIIAKDTIIRGNIEHTGDIRIEGTLEGNINNKEGIVIISSTSQVIGNIHSDRIVLSGTLNGDVYGHQIIEITSTANVIGNVISPLVVSSPGFKFKGRLSTLKNAS